MTEKQLADCIYDLIREAILPNNQDDSWSDLVKKHAKDSRKELRNLAGHKCIEVSGNKIVLGTNKPASITVTI